MENAIKGCPRATHARGLVETDSQQKAVTSEQSAAADGRVPVGSARDIIVLTRGEVKCENWRRLLTCWGPRNSRLRNEPRNTCGKRRASLNLKLGKHLEAAYWHPWNLALLETNYAMLLGPKIESMR
jgi:hypothetical protein